MTKQEIMKKISTFEEDEEIYNFIKERVEQLETEIEEKGVEYEGKYIIEDYISSKVKYTPCPEDNRQPSIIYDDITPYFETIKKLKESNEYLPEIYLFTPLTVAVRDYLVGEDSDPVESLLERTAIYYNAYKRGDKTVSIKKFHERKIGFCSEIAGLAQNILKILGISSQLVIGQRDAENHAYILIYPRGYENKPAVLYDPSFYLNFKNEEGKIIESGYFKVLTDEEYDDLFAQKPVVINVEKSAKNIMKYYGLKEVYESNENATYYLGKLKEKKKNSGITRILFPELLDKKSS